MDYYRRALQPLITRALKQFPALLLTGPRQAGKSTLLCHTFPDIPFFTLDDPLLQERAQEDPALFLHTLPEPCIIDEIQLAPQLLPHIKMRIDQDRHLRGRYLLTGSQVFQLMEGVTESLAGRIALFELYPLSWAELGTIPGYERAVTEARRSLEVLVRGFYPELYQHPDIQEGRWYGSYLKTYVERDVRSIQKVTDLSLFQKFLRLLATRVGSQLNLSELARDCGISQSTAKGWLSILEATYMVYLLQPWFHNRTKRLIKAPKVYFVDTGLLCYLMGIGSVDRFLGAKEQGALFENMVIIDQLKQATTASTPRYLSYYRTADGAEVDLIIESEGKIAAYELKFSERIQKRMASGLTQFLKTHPEAKGTLLSLRAEPFPLTAEVACAHWSTLVNMYS
ncbi:MAG: ATP-binding protein [Parachlamydiales bacterium]